MADDRLNSPEDDALGSRENRLPSLSEVLSRRTLPPVDLFSFYIYMRDQQRSVDYLDFWLDVSQHLSLCRHYVREMHRSVLLETPEFDRATGNGNGNGTGSKQSFQLDDRGKAPSSKSEREQDMRVSQVLRENSSKHSHKESGDSRVSSRPHTPRTGATGNGTGNGTGTGTGSNDRNRPSFHSAHSGLPHDSSSPEKDSTPAHTVTRQDIRASAEKILYTFLLQGSEREIILPPGILQDITDSIEEQGRDDPEVFDAAKEYVFQAMERDAFPGFLRAKALGNLVPPSLMLRLILGLLAIFGGFWAAFVLVFLDASRSTRCWIILPFIIGVYSLASHQYTVDPILAFIGFSEYTFFSFNRVKEPFVRRLLVKRALVLSVAILLITAAVVCLFVFVPGKHL